MKLKSIIFELKCLLVFNICLQKVENIELASNHFIKIVSNSSLLSKIQPCVKNKSEISFKSSFSTVGYTVQKLENHVSPVIEDCYLIINESENESSFKLGFEFNFQDGKTTFRLLPHNLSSKCRKSSFSTFYSDGPFQMISLYNQSSISNNSNIEKILKKHKNSIDFKQRMDFNGSDIAVVAQYDPDYKERIEIRTLPNGTTAFESGMCLELLQALEYSLNFRHKAISGNGWAGLLPNGSWTGMSKQIITGEADVSIAQASMIMMQEQLPHINFLHSTSFGRIIAIFQQPRAHSFRNLITTSFDMSLWICLFTTWTFLVLFIYLFIRIYDIFISNVSNEDLEFAENLVLWAITTFCCKGWHMVPSNGFLRCLFAIAMALTSVVFVAYSAALVLSLSSEVIPIKSYPDLASSQLLLHGDVWLPFVQRLVEDAYELRKSSVVPESQFIDIDQAITRNFILSQANYAFLTFADAIPNVFRRLNLSDISFCSNIFTIAVTKVPLANGMFVRQHSPLKEPLNRIIIIMTERGINFRLNNQYGVETNIMCSKPPSGYRGGLGTLDIFTAHIFILMGVCFSITGLIFEIIFRWCNFREYSLFSYHKRMLPTQ